MKTLIVLLSAVFCQLIFSDAIDDCKRNCGINLQCSFQDDEDCKNYVHCYRFAGGNTWTRLVRPCGFGKVWSTERKVCVHVGSFNCTVDPCASGRLKYYKYTAKETDKSENTCGKHWVCINQKSKADCCCEGHAFVEGEGCVVDKNCTGSCKTFPRTSKCAALQAINKDSPNLNEIGTAITTNVSYGLNVGSEIMDIPRKGQIEKGLLQVNGLIGDISNNNRNSELRPQLDNQVSSDTLLNNETFTETTNSDQSTGEILQSNQGTGEVMHSKQGTGEIMHSNQDTGEIVHSNQGTGEVMHSDQASGETTQNRKGTGEHQSNTDSLHSSIGAGEILGSIETVLGTDGANLIQRDPCQDPVISVEGHYWDSSLINHGCRSFWMCIDGVSRFSCCPSGSRYVNASGCKQDHSCYGYECIPLQTNDRFVCTTEEVPGQRRKYIQTVDAIKYNRECACGLMYEKTDKYCGCVEDPYWSSDPECTGCRPDVDLSFNETSIDLNCDVTSKGTGSQSSNTLSKDDIWSNSGGQKSVELHGVTMVCTPDDNLMAGKFGYGSYMEIPFFQNNAEILKNLFLQIKFKPTNVGSTRQVLVSNCRFGEPYPSFRIIVDKGRSQLRIWASTAANNVSLHLPYEEFQWNEVIVSYDGNLFKAEVIPDTPRRPNIQYKDKRLLSGEILVSVKPGLRVGSCAQSADDSIGDFFNGFIKYIKTFSCKSV